MADGRPGVGLREVARGWRWGGRTLVPASAEAHRPAVPAREFPTAWSRRPAARVARTAFLEGAMNPLMHYALTPVASGVEVFEDLGDRAVLIVANHSSHVDTPLLLCALPREVRERTAVTAAADYFFESTWRGLSTALAFGTVPIERRGGAPSSTPVDLVNDGWNLVIFPEGTRSPDGARGRFRHGAAYLALTTGVPVVPAGLRGTFGAMPRGRSWPVPGRPVVSVRFGKPMRPEAGEDVRAFTARLSAAVARLVTEDETDWWTSLRTGSADAPPRRTGAGAGPDAAGRTSPSAAGGRGAAGSRGAGGGGRPARWRRVWAATEPPSRTGPRSPWS